MQQAETRFLWTTALSLNLGNRPSSLRSKWATGVQLVVEEAKEEYANKSRLRHRNTNSTPLARQGKEEETIPALSI